MITSLLLALLTLTAQAATPSRTLTPSSNPAFAQLGAVQQVVSNQNLLFGEEEDFVTVNLLRFGNGGAVDVVISLIGEHSNGWKNYYLKHSDFHLWTDTPVKFKMISKGYFSLTGSFTDPASGKMMETEKTVKFRIKDQDFKHLVIE